MIFREEFFVELRGSFEEMASNIARNINSVIGYLKSLLRFDPFMKIGKISFRKMGKNKIIGEDVDFSNLGVIREENSNTVNLTFDSTYENFIRELIVREALRLFVPPELNKLNLIKASINIIVQSFCKLSTIEQWRKKATHKSMNHFLLNEQIDKLEQFFLMKRDVYAGHPINYFFDTLILRKEKIKNNPEGFFDFIFELFASKFGRSYRDDEIIETFRNLYLIFRRKKRFSTKSKYKLEFKKSSDRNKSFMSLNKFEQGFDWIINHSNISPSYFVNPKKMGLVPVLGNFLFHPSLSWKIVRNIVEDLPFFIAVRLKMGFSIQAMGWFVISPKYARDLKYFIETLKDSGHLIYGALSNRIDFSNILNLDFFSKENEILTTSTEDKILHWGTRGNWNEMDLTIFDYLIFERARNWAATGLGFKKNVELARLLKKDQKNFINSQQSELLWLGNVVKKLKKSENSKKFAILLKKFRSKGLFYVEKFLETLIFLSEFFEAYASKNQIKSVGEIIEKIKNNSFRSSISLENSHYFENKEAIDSIVKLFSFTSGKKKRLERLQQYKEQLDYIKAFHKFKIYSIQAILNLLSAGGEERLSELFSTEQVKLNEAKEIKLSGKIIDEKLNRLIFEKKILVPEMITTITSSSNNLIELYAKPSKEVKKSLLALKRFFPRMLISKYEDFIHLSLYSKNIKQADKSNFLEFSINKFSDNILNFFLSSHTGFISHYSHQEHYNFKEKRYFYSPYLYSEYSRYVKSFLPDVYPLGEYSSKSTIFLWPENSDLSMEKIAKVVKVRNARKEPIDLKYLKELSNINEGIVEDIEIKKRAYFKKHVNEINIKPAWKRFGLSEYKLIFQPENPIEIDFRLLLSNVFTDFKQDYSLGPGKAFYINYIFPNNSPGDSLLNWYAFSKKNIAFFALLKEEKMVSWFHDKQFEPKGAKLDYLLFEKHVNDVLLHNKGFGPQKVQVFEIDTKNMTIDNKGPQNEYFRIIKKYFKRGPVNLKSLVYLTDKIFEEIRELIAKNLITLTYEFKDISLDYDIKIAVLDLNEFQMKTLTKIFKFFNKVRVLEISGNVFTKGEEPITFEKGLLIEINMTDENFTNYQKLIAKTFEFLQIRYFSFLNLIDGDPLLKSLYGEELKDYKTLENLKWSKRYKKYINVKLFDEKFTKLYPLVTKMNED